MLKSIPRKRFSELLLIGLLFCSVCSINSFSYMMTGIPMLGSALMLLLIVILYLVWKGPQNTLGIIHGCLILLFVIIASLFGAVNGEQLHWSVYRGPIGSILIVSCVATVFAGLSDEAKGRIFICITWMFIAVSISILLSPYLYSLYKVPPPDVRRFTGVYMNPNESAMLASLGLGFCLYYFFKLGRYTYLIFACLCGLAIVLTFSKAGIIAGIVVAITGLRHSFWARHFRRGLLTILVVVVFSFSAYLSVAPKLDLQQAERIFIVGRLIAGDINEDTTTQRTRIWAEAVRKISENHWLVGEGLGAMGRVEDGIRTENRWMGVHNYWLMLLGDGGLLPFTLLILFYVFLARQSTRQNEWKELALIYWLVFFIDTMGTHGILELRYHACLIGVMCGLVRIKNGKRLI